jgi:hypothetical protein
VDGFASGTSAVKQNHCALHGKRRDAGAANRGQEGVDLCIRRRRGGAGSFGNTSACAHQIDRFDRLHQKVGGPHLQQCARDIFIERLRHCHDRRPRADPRHQPGKRRHLIRTTGIEIDHNNAGVGDIERVALLGEAA